MKIYTKTGDQGTTALFHGGRVTKSHPRVEAYGTVDELNSALGVVRAFEAHSDEWLHRIQVELFALGADLATPLDAEASWVVRVSAEAVVWLEESIDEMSATLPLLQNFIVPGGCLVAAHLHVARTICRRAERLTVALSEAEQINPQAIIYLNRLSDFLFTLARYENAHAQINDEKWSIRP